MRKNKDQKVKVKKLKEGQFKTDTLFEHSQNYLRLLSS